MTQTAQTATDDKHVGAAAGLDPSMRVHGSSAVVAFDERNAGGALAESSARELELRPLSTRERTALAMAGMSLDETLRLASTLWHSGICPSHVKKPEQAFAIILAGRELGIGPMLALRSVQLIKGKMTLAADLQLGLFKSSGGRAEFKELSDDRAELHMRHPNGDTHVETFSMDEAERAGLLAEQPNYRKFPKAMLRSRCITNGLKSLGFEPTSGAYDPDEAQHFLGPVEGATFTGTTGTGSDEVSRRDAAQQQTRSGPTFPYDPYKNVAVAARHPANTIIKKRTKKGSDETTDVDVSGQYIVPFKELQRCIEWAEKKITSGVTKRDGNDVPLDDAGRARLQQVVTDMRAEIDRREVEAEQMAAATDPSSEGEQQQRANPTTAAPASSDSSAAGPASVASSDSATSTKGKRKSGSRSDDDTATAPVQDEDFEM